MSVLLTADLHLNNLPRDQYRHDWQKEFRDLARKHKVSTACIIGDLTDEKDHHPATLVNRVVDHIYELAKICVVVIDTGNHDYTALAETPFFQFLRRVTGVHWVSAPTRGADLPNLPASARADLSKVLILPHSPNIERDWKGLSFKGIDTVLAHQTFAGAINEHGKPLSGITTFFPEHVQIISGDVHTPQTLGPVTYIGAPYTVDFGDDFEPRVGLLNGSKLTFIPCSGSQKRLVEVTSPSKLTAKGLRPGDIVKVRVDLDIGQYAKWGAIKREVEEWGAKNKLTVHLVQPQTKRSAIKREAVKREDPKTDKELIRDYAKRKQLDERTIKVGLEIVG